MTQELEISSWVSGMMLSCNARLAVAVVVATVLLVGGVPYWSDSARAQRSTPSKSAQQLVQDGLKAQRARNHNAAVALFSRAINAGGLARKQLAYALYYRAQSNRARRHPAEAISDLNSALFFDGDLSSRDRAKAILERKKAFRDAGLKPTALAAAQPIVPTPQEGGAGWGAATRSASPATPPKQNRIITASPRRVLEPIKVNRPRSVASAWPAHSPILPPASDQAAQGPAKARSIPTFQTRVAARTVPERSYSTPSTSQRSYLKPTVERGVGQVSGATGRKAVQAPVKAATPWQVSSTQPQQRGPSGWPASIQQQSAPERATEQPAPVRPAGEPTQSVGGAIGSATAGLGRFFANLVSPTAGAGNAVTRMAGSQENAADDDVAATPRVRTARVNGDAQAPRVPPPAAKAQASSPPSTGPTGRFAIKVLGLPSKDRAEAVAERLLAQQAGVGSAGAEHAAHVLRSASADGTSAVYAVRYGGLKNLNESLGMCEQLKADGLACKVIPQY